VLVRPKPHCRCSFQVTLILDQFCMFCVREIPQNRVYSHRLDGLLKWIH
jgi:hypothetical protein